MPKYPQHSGVMWLRGVGDVPWIRDSEEAKPVGAKCSWVAKK